MTEKTWLLVLETEMAEPDSTHSLLTIDSIDPYERALIVQISCHIRLPRLN